MGKKECQKFIINITQNTSLQTKDKGRRTSESLNFFLFYFYQEIQDDLGKERITAKSRKERSEYGNRIQDRKQGFIYLSGW